MLACAKSPFFLRHQFQRCVGNEFKRFYAPRSSDVENDFELSNHRIPARLKKRLAQQGLRVEDLQISSEIDSASEALTKPRDSSVPTGSTLATEHELTDLLKNVASIGPETTNTPTEVFPSDALKYYDWKRQQSRKAFRPRVDPSKTTLILFPGQGSQFVGMGKDTLGYGRARELFEEASAILKYDLLKMCLDGPMSTLSKTVHCQPTVLVASLAAIEKLQEQNIEAVECCVGTAGFSVGEFTALVFSGVMSFADAVEVVRVRAEAMQHASEEVSSGMMTTFLGPASKLKTAMEAARDYCQQRCHIQNPVCTIANYLYPECKVIAGHTQALDFVEKHAKTFGIRRTKHLPVSGAFHTKLMSSALRPLRDVLHRVTLSPPEIAVYSNVTASPCRKPEKVAELLQKQVVSPVKWEQTMHVMYSRPQGEEFPASFEAGPGSQLGMMLKCVNLKAYEKYTHVDV